MKHLTKTLALLLVALLLLPGCVSQYANKVDKEPTAAPATEAPAPTEEPAPTEAPAQQAEATAEPEPEPTEAPAPTEEPVAREKQTLQVWYAVSGTSGEKFTALSKEFDDQSDLVDLELSYSGGSADTATKVSAALLTNTQPDVALMYAGPLYTGGRNDYAMEELMKREGFGMDDIFPGMLDYCTYMGQGICAVPFGISTQVMYYNKTLLEKAGVDMTNPPKTWQEFYDLCADLLTKVEGDDFTAFDVSDAPWLFKSMLKQNGCEIVVQGEDGKIQPVYNNEAALEVTDFWYSLVTSGIMAAGEHDNAENRFLSGNCAFIAATSNRISRWRGATEFELGAIEMPYFKNQSLALGGNVMVILTDDPQKVEAAWEYVSYLTTAENNAEFALATGYLPIRKSELNNPDIQKALSENALYSIAFKQLDYTFAYTHFEQMGTMDSLIRNMLNKLEKNRGTSQALLDKAVKDLQSEIDEG